MWKLAKGTIAGGVVVFLWGAFSYMVLPWHDLTTNKFISEPVVSQVLVDQSARSGVYVLPNPRKDAPENEEQASAERTAAQEQTRRGPVAFVALSRAGVVGMGSMMLIGLLTNLAGAFLMTWLLAHTGPMDFGERVQFITMAALFAAVVCHTPYWNWFGFGTAYTLVMYADTVLGWTLAGLAIAKLTEVVPGAGGEKAG